MGPGDPQLISDSPKNVDLRAADGNFKIATSFFCFNYLKRQNPKPRQKGSSPIHRLSGPQRLVG